mmetsp:Transcript_41388/g.66343  ORF Transcript_41388/g.66343 Transcript_41388/m.66343 type:complete len:262 (-) Transcript_41388:459-1244(-)
MAKCCSAAALIPPGWSSASAHPTSPFPASCCCTACLSHLTSFLYTLPCSTSSTWRSNLHASGTLRFRCSYAVSRVALLGTHPRPAAIFHTWVSTGNSARCKQNMSTHDTVFGPTPLNRDSSFLAASSSIPRRYSMHACPRSSTRVLRMTWMRVTLISAKPPDLMASSTSLGLATRTDSQVGKRAFKMPKARWLLESVVFCERMVPTSESRTHLRAAGCSRTVSPGTTGTMAVEVMTASAGTGAGAKRAGVTEPGPRALPPP